MKLWFSSSGPHSSRRCRRSAPTGYLLLEPLEDRCVPSISSMPASASVAPSPSASIPAAVNPIASLSHDQIHDLQAQSQQQTAIATVRLEVEQTVLGILQLFAPQAPQFQPAIALLIGAIPTQQAAVNSFQNQTNLLNQLDDLQDQSITLSAQIQSANGLLPTLQQLGDVQTANMLQNIIAADQATVQALQPQIAAVEVEVSAFV